MSDEDDLHKLVKLLESRFADDQTDLYRRALEQFDRVLLRRALERCEGNLTRAAALLGLSRVTLRSKLRALGLSTGKGSNSQGAEGHPAPPAAQSAPQGHAQTPQTHAPPSETGQNLTRTDPSGAESREPHVGDTARRQAAGFPNR